MKVQDLDNEAKAIMTLVGFADKPKAILAGTLRADHFSEPRCVELHTRIMAMAKGREHLPTYDTLQHDTLLSEESRALLDNQSYPPVKTAGDAEQLIAALELHRKARVFMNGLAKATDMMTDDQADPDEAFHVLEEILHEGRSEAADEVLSIGPDGNYLEAVAELLTRKKPDTIPTGFHEFDNSAGGLPRSGLTTLAATSGGGKSCMAVQIAINAVRAGYSACIVTLEMTKDQTTGRVTANIAGVDYGAIYGAKLNDMQKTRIGKAAAAWQKECDDAGKSLRVLHRPHTSLTEIALEMRALCFDLVIVDYINLLQTEETTGKNSNDAKQLGDIAKEAKIQAGASKAAWVMLAQLNDAGDVKYSKAIKENSDYMLTWVYGDAERESHLVEINIAKARHSPSFKFPLRESFKTQRFENPGNPDTNKDVKIKKGKKAKAHPTAKPMFGPGEDDDDDL